MKSKFFVFVFAFVFALSFAGATDLIFKQNDVVNYSFVCLDTGNDFCGASTACNMNINSPNGTNLFSNSSMTFTPTAFFHILPTDDLGIHNWLVICDVGGNATSEGTYEINRAGSNTSTGQGLLYIVIFGFAIVMFLVFLTACIRTEWNNYSNNLEEMPSVNWNKYMKFVYGFLSYVCLLFIFFIGKGITENFLFLDTASAFFRVGTTLLIIAAGPGIIVGVFFLSLNIATDKRNARELRRGLPPQLRGTR